MDSHIEDWIFITPSSQYHWDDSSSSSASSTPRRPLSKLPSTTPKRPQLRHRHTPEVTHLLSLVHAHEPIEVPVPPSLQAKGRILSERSVSQTQIPRRAWYDYNEFGTLEEKRSSASQDRRSSSTDSRRSNSVASVLAPHHTFEPAALIGDAGVHQAFHWTSSTPYGDLPSQPLLIPQQINNMPPPLSLPSPVVSSSFGHQ